MPPNSVRSFLVSRGPSTKRRFRPYPERQVALALRVSLKKKDDKSDATYVIPQASTNTHSEQEGALIYLRMHPLPNGTPCSDLRITGNTLVTSQLDKTGNIIEKHFVFTKIFDNAIDQCSIYEKCIRSKIESQESFTILTCGSGKTHTLLGDVEKPGIIPRAIENVYAMYTSYLYPEPAAKAVNAIVCIVDDESKRTEMRLRQKIVDACNDMQYNQVQQKISSEHEFTTTFLESTSVMIWVSFVEIYEECVYDLLSPVAATASTKRQYHKIASNDGKAYIKDLTSVWTKMPSDAYNLLSFGLQKVTYASTAANSNSSCSHCIFFLDVIKYFASGTYTLNTYTFCDLARKVGSSDKEAKCINKSLLVLGQCLNAANNNRKKKNADVIPFRDSKLTMLLQSALLGKEKLSMVVNITPSNENFEENRKFLNFASMAENNIFKQPIYKSIRKIFTLLNETRKLKNTVSRVEKSRRQQECDLLNRNTVSSLEIEENDLRNEFNTQLAVLVEENLTFRNKNETLMATVSRLEKALSQQKHNLYCNQLADNFEKSLRELNSHWEDRLTRVKRNFVPTVGNTTQLNVLLAENLTLRQQIEYLMATVERLDIALAMKEHVL